MKCHRKASPYSACFASRSCARFSPTTVTPASISAAMSCSATYFVAATIVTCSPTRACTSATRSRMTSGDCTDHSLDAALAAVSPMREEELGVAARAQVDTFDGCDSRVAQRALGRRPQIEVTVHGEVRVEARRDFLADLVTARPDRRADDCGRLAADGCNAGGDDAAAQPTPSGVHERKSSLIVGAGDR